ncbi:hypothetical protein [Enterococcus cecorum]|uniref:hypothetical protein n=1 Tax=Enterococcus cecorum TaxID=44008 RepID=UPI00148D4168|nr:hypothetical protein [Enterococcus cecorum]
MNSLNLRQVCGGDTIKQADFGSELAFELLDEQYVKFREPLGESAKVILKKDNTAIYQKSVPITQNTVLFNFDKILPVGSYVLEIVVGNYVFPSNNRIIITIEQTYGDFEAEYLVKVSYEELKADVDDVKTKIEQLENTLNANETNVNQELFAINQNASDMNKRIESLENREDKDTVYDDTSIKQSISDVNTKVDNLSEKVTALEERPIVDTALTKRVETLEQKEDKDTVYDDSAIIKRIESLENSKTSSGGSYNDTEVKARLKSLETETILGRNLLNEESKNRIEINKDAYGGIYREIMISDLVNPSTLYGQTFSFSYVGFKDEIGVPTPPPNTQKYDTIGRFGAHIGVFWKDSKTGQTRNQWLLTGTETGNMMMNDYLDGIKRTTFKIPLTFFRDGLTCDTITGMSIRIYLSQKPTNESTWYLEDFRVEKTSALDGIPYNSVICLNSNTPPTEYYGGYWKKLGEEQKFGNTLIYWQKVDQRP